MQMTTTMLGMVISLLVFALIAYIHTLKRLREVRRQLSLLRVVRFTPSPRVESPQEAAPILEVLEVDPTDILGPPTQEELQWAGTNDLNTGDLKVLIEHSTELIDLNEVRTRALEAMIDEEIVRPDARPDTSYAFIRRTV